MVDIYDNFHSIDTDPMVTFLLWTTLFIYQYLVCTLIPSISSPFFISFYINLSLGEKLLYGLELLKIYTLKQFFMCA